MKKIILAFLLVAPPLWADELHNFEQIKTAVITGKTIHIVIDFSKCSFPKIPELSLIGIFTPNAIQVVNNSIATSLNHFTLNNPSFPETPVYEFVRYTITDDNMVKLTSQILDAKEYKPMSDKFSSECQIDTGAKIYGKIS